ncbi:MAG: D-alanine--D-alanine ligase [Acidimicrobiia bacterium]|nr:D-alanine--D-alanine ligase [Acidimicrobiia bacterium]
MSGSSRSFGRRLRIVVLFGGRSAEHDVSRVTAASVAGALDPDRYEVIPVGITREGRWLLAGDAAKALERGDLPAAFDVGGDPVAQLADPGTPHLVPVDTTLDAAAGLRADVVFPVLHGPYGEDGTVQGLLELAGIPYVGSGVLGSAVAMDKIMAKRAFSAVGLTTAASVDHRVGGDRDALRTRVSNELGYPCFVKPANMGSSIGVAKVGAEPELDAAVDAALAFDEWVLVEEMVAGREIEVAVLGDALPEASVPGEIAPGAEFYTYADKYEDGAELYVPARLDGDRTEEVRSLALRAFDACRCEAMARVDFFFEERRFDGSAGRGFLVNEVNTIPGFTPISMYPKLWEASGLSYSALLDRLVDLALDRGERRAGRAGARG